MLHNDVFVQVLKALQLMPELDRMKGIIFIKFTD